MLKNIKIKKLGKKGFSFFYLLFVFIILVAFLNYNFFINYNESIPKDYKVSETLNKIIFLKEKKNIYDNFYDNFFNIMLSDIERNFILNYFKENIKKSSLNSYCLYKKTEIIYFNENRMTNCLLDDNLEIEKDFKDYLNYNLNNNLPQGFTYNLNDLKNNKIVFKKEEKEKIQGDKISVNANLFYEYSYNLNLKKEIFILKEFKNLFENKTKLDELKTKISQNYVKCVNNKTNMKEKCYEMIILEYLKTKGINLENMDLQLNVEEYQYYEDVDSYALKFNFKSLSNDYFFIDFLIILKKFENPIIEFNLYDGNLNIQENNIKVEIIKGISDPIYENLYVFYSYDNLENKEINLNNLNELDSDLNAGYYKKNPKISYFKIKDPKYELDILDNNKKNITYIYQIFNPTSNKFNLLEDNKEIYVSVIGIKKNSELNNIKLNNIKKITIKRNLLKEKPLPYVPGLNSRFIKSFGDSFGYRIDLKKYENNYLDHFDIYLLEENKGYELKDCLSNPNICYIYEGKNNLIKTPSKIKILNSDLEDLNTNFYDLYIKKNDFNPPLEFTKNYKFYIIPKNKNEEGIFEDIKKPFDLEFDGNNKIYKIKNDVDETIRISYGRLVYN
jgi:hypothetical protein